MSKGFKQKYPGFMRLLLLAGLVLLLMMVACTPVASDPDRVEVAQVRELSTYYPHQAGAEWRYLQENVALNSLPLVLRVEGPTIIGGDLWIKSRLEGQGLEVVRYRQYRPEGVFLLREERPGTQISFEPAIQQFPEEASLKVGASWKGQTVAKLFFPDAQPENQRSEVALDYLFIVVDKRSVSLPAGQFEVFVINFVSRTLDEEGNIVEEYSQELWFSPYVGEVRTEQGYFLISSNVIESN